MKPPVCAACGKRFDPFRSLLGRRGGTVEFSNHKPLPDGMTGHPSGTEWFCRRHFGAAKALEERTLGGALAVLRGRRAARWLGLILVLLLIAMAWNLTGPV